MAFLTHQLRSHFGDVHRREGLVNNSVQRRISNLEEVKSREWNKVHRQFSQIGIQLAGEAQRTSNSAHDLRHKIVQVFVLWTKGQDRTKTLAHLDIFRVFEQILYSAWLSKQTTESAFSIS